VLLSRIAEIQPTLTGQTAVEVGLVVLVLVAFPWYVIVQPFSTLAHEGAHGFTAWNLGANVREVHLGRDGTGFMIHSEVGFFADLLIAVSGYLGPSAGGLLAAKLIARGHSVAVLWLMLVLVGLVLTQMNNLFGAGIAVLAGASIYLAIRYMSITRETVLAYAIAWFLLLSGVRTVIMRGPEAGDAAYLRDVTHLPRMLWALVWLAGTGAALYYGGRMLI
jgi:hypothetical protein